MPVALMTVLALTVMLIAGLDVLDDCSGDLAVCLDERSSSGRS
jgi:hypothetical protein